LDSKTSKASEKIGTGFVFGAFLPKTKKTLVFLPAPKRLLMPDINRLSNESARLQLINHKDFASLQNQASRPQLTHNKKLCVIASLRLSFFLTDYCC
jgi:hypothetical protein